MKYRTKATLPLTIVGTEITVFSKGCVPIAIYNGATDISISEEYIPILLKQGWIEEVKPRELYISKSVLRDYAKESVEEFFHPQRKDLVKIKEVIE